jgi:hypothetical protein
MSRTNRRTRRLVVVPTLPTPTTTHNQLICREVCLGARRGAAGELPRRRLVAFSVFEYSRAANPIGSGFTPKVPVVRFSPEIYVDEPTGIVPLDLSKELGITTGEATILGDRTVFNSRVEPRTNADVRAELGLHIGPRRR